jgi:hypothetical protein
MLVIKKNTFKNPRKDHLIETLSIAPKEGVNRKNKTNRG